MTTVFTTLPNAPRLSPPSIAPAFTPDPNWDLDRIYEAQDSHESGHFYDSALLAHWMKRDGRLSAVLETRISKVFGLPFLVEPPSEEPLRLEKKIAKAYQDQWTSILSEKAAKEILEWVILMGFCFAQLRWHDLGPGEKARWRPTVIPWSPQWFRYNQWEQCWQVQTRGCGLENITPNDGRWVLFSTRKSQPWMAGAVRSLAIPVLVRSWTWKDMSNQSETLGKAFLKGIVPAWAMATEDDPISGTPSKSTFFAAAAGLGRSTSFLACEMGADGNSFDAKYEGLDAGKTYEAFHAQRAAADTEITIRIKGQNLTTEVGANGAKSAVESHGEVDQDILESDCELLSTDSREGIAKHWALVNHGDADLAPWAGWDPTPPEDNQTKAVTLKDLAPALAILDQQLAPHGKRIDLPVMMKSLGIELKDLESALAPAPATPAPGHPFETVSRHWAAAYKPDARVVIALYPSPEVQRQLVIPDGEYVKDLHLTLVYLGRVSELEGSIEGLVDAVRRFAASYAPISSTVGGLGRFSASESSEGYDVIYASVDAPNLATLREHLVMELEGLVTIPDEHGFTPHITLAYIDSFAESPLDRIEPIDVRFSAIELVVEGVRQAFPLQGLRERASRVPFKNKRGAR